MAKSLNDILNGVKKSKVEAGTTGDNPGVDYAEKMKDGRDFVAQHKVEKHEDRVGNDDEVYKASKIKQSKDDNHGHTPDPKAKNAYAAANQQNESKMVCEDCGEEPCGCGGMKKGKKVLTEKKPKNVHEAAIMKAVEMVQRSKASELLDEDTVKSQLRDLSAKSMEIVLSSSDDFINESYVQHKIAQANKAIEDIHELMNFKNKKKIKSESSKVPNTTSLTGEFAAKNMGYV